MKRKFAEGGDTQEDKEIADGFPLEGTPLEKPMPLEDDFDAIPEEEEEEEVAPTLAPQDTLVPSEPAAPSQAMAEMPRAAPEVSPSSSAPAAQQVADQQFALQGPETPQQTSQYLKQQDALWADDLVNQHIKPQTYADLFEKKSTLGKVGTIFGLMISGAGAGLTKQPNALMEMMNKEIQNDLDAQKQSKSNGQNFIKLNQEHLAQQAQIGLNRELAKGASAETKLKADSLAHMQANRAALHSLTRQVERLAAAAASDPTNQQKAQQLQRAQQMLGMVASGVDALNSDIADRAAATSALLQGFANQNNQASSDDDSAFQAQQRVMKMSGNPLLEALAVDNESKHVPGLGKASISLSGQDREQINAGINFQDQLQRFIDWSKNHSGSLNPKSIKEGKALAAGLQGAYRQATDGGVYKSGEQDFISSIIDSDPTKFFNSIRVLPSLKAVQNDSKAQFDNLLKHKGLPLYKPKENSKQPEQYKTVNGVKYRRLPNGKAERVN